MKDEIWEMMVGKEGWVESDLIAHPFNRVLVLVGLGQRGATGGLQSYGLQVTSSKWFNVVPGSSAFGVVQRHSGFGDVQGCRLAVAGDRVMSW